MSRLKANRYRPFRIARDLPTILHRVQSEQSEHFVNVFPEVSESLILLRLSIPPRALCRATAHYFCKGFAEAAATSHRSSF